MSRLIYYVASSLDGFIADEHDSLDWLLSQEQAPGGGNDYESFIANIGAIAMGSTTYEWVLANGGWGYEMPAWVLTTRELAVPPVAEGAAAADVHFAHGQVTEVYEAMREAARGKDLWVVGGGDLAGQFADAGLLDEVHLSIAPVTLAGGRPLLPRRLDLELIEHSTNGAFLTARHRVRRQGN
ncbi:dihydrofolate reductase [Leucobacter komagatae]|uniref:Dihydrofolate reductase n=1 Tax=Leucobacter komagatae TaxID=55969 RepID=A0A542Y494_9MICO|nr:dihydrofolate reductase family protein [Leucobacter komagatae]TQL42889.1 dihydrofolate reductase [Leucobacter komagatae]